MNSIKVWENYQTSLIDGTVYQEKLIIFSKFHTILKNH